jgi:hypothetical protein
VGEAADELHKLVLCSLQQLPDDLRQLLDGRAHLMRQGHQALLQLLADVGRQRCWEVPLLHQHTEGTFRVAEQLLADDQIQHQLGHVI